MNRENNQGSNSGKLSFDSNRLDTLLADADIDVLVVTSKHNVQYMMGGYQFFFFEGRDAIGISRYMPVVVYQRGKPDNTAYIGCRMEAMDKELGARVPVLKTISDYGMDAMQGAVSYITDIGANPRRIGVEMSFLPADAQKALSEGFGDAEIVDAWFPLERLRVRKTPSEIANLREASEQVVASMLATFKACVPGMSKREIVERLRREEVHRGLTFEYCLIAAGANLNRGPSEQRLVEGDILSLDSGGHFNGYIGDLCRMGILGKLDAELEECLIVVDEIQQAARKPIAAGARGGEIYAAAEQALKGSPHRGYIEFLAHGMGLVAHEGPRLTNAAPIPYDSYDAERPLESGMVVSLETSMVHPRRGFIKLEDTIVVSGNGHEALGDGGRGWNAMGIA